MLFFMKRLRIGQAYMPVVNIYFNMQECRFNKLRYRPSDRFGDHTDLLHHLFKLVREK
jgi:hypothetical protein